MSEQIAFLGAGVMGGALLSSILRNGYPASDVVVGEIRAERAAELRSQHGVEVTDPRSAASDADVLIVGVKPQDVATLLADVADVVRPDAVVVSLAAGVPIATYAASLPGSVAIVRVMPNTPALVGKGVFGVSRGVACTEGQLNLVVRMLSPAGIVEVVDESVQDAVTAVSGSGPAYVFYLAEQMIAAGVEAGLTPQVARRLAVGTVAGAAALMSSSDADPAELRRQVTSPNGTTAAAIAAFEEAGVAASLRAGVKAAADRSAELSR
jgi:pyrroline-5-carboxylate reductase